MNGIQWFCTKGNGVRYHIWSDGHALCNKSIKPRALSEPVQAAELPIYAEPCSVCQDKR